MLYSEGPSIQEAASTSEHSSSQTGRNIIADEPKTSRLLAYVQILTASSASFAHGSNDVRYVFVFFFVSLCYLYFKAFFLK